MRGALWCVWCYLLSLLRKWAPTNTNGSEEIKKELGGTVRKGPGCVSKVGIADTSRIGASTTTLLLGGSRYSLNYVLFSLFFFFPFSQEIERERGEKKKNTTNNYLFVLSNLIYAIHQIDRLFGKPDGSRLKSSVFPACGKFCPSGRTRRSVRCVRCTSSVLEPPSVVPDPTWALKDKKPPRYPGKCPPRRWCHDSSPPSLAGVAFLRFGPVEIALVCARFRGSAGDICSIFLWVRRY